MSNKINTAEAILLIMCAIAVDAINWVPVVNWIVGIVALPATQLYLRLKGIRGVHMFIGNLIEFIPIVSALPVYTAAMAATIYIDRHPKIAQKLSAAAPVKMSLPTVRLAKVTEVIRRAQQ